MPSTLVSTTMQPQRELGQQHFSHEVTIPSDPAEARRVQDEIEGLIKGTACSERELFSVKLALEEALVNAIKHGNQYDRNKTVVIRYHVEHDHFVISIADQGEGFDPADVPDPTAIENLERPCGRGLMLMRHYMTEVRFANHGASVTMTKVFRNGRK